MVWEAVGPVVELAEFVPAPVPVAMPTTLEVLFCWKRTWGRSEAVELGSLVLMEVVGRPVVEAVVVTVVLLAPEVVVGVEPVVGVVGDWAAVDAGVAAAEVPDSESLGEGDPEPALESPTGKTTTLAVNPAGIVTTQKLAPPAPEAPSGLVTPPTPSTEGSIEQGRPLHPEPEHSIFTPKVGEVPLSGELVNSGFHATFAYVRPLASVLAPAT